MLPFLSPKEGGRRRAAGASRLEGEGSGSPRWISRTRRALGPLPTLEPGPGAAHLHRPAATGADRAGCRGGRSGSSDGTAAAPLHAPRRRSRDGRGGAAGRMAWNGMGWPGLGGRRPAGMRESRARPAGKCGRGGGGAGVATGTGKRGPCGLAAVLGKEASGTARRGSEVLNEAGRNVLLAGGLRVGHLFGSEGTAREGWDFEPPSPLCEPKAMALLGFGRNGVRSESKCRWGCEGASKGRPRQQQITLLVPSARESWLEGLSFEFSLLSLCSDWRKALGERYPDKAVQGQSPCERKQELSVLAPSVWEPQQEPR